MPVTIDLAFEVMLTGDGTPLQKANELFFFTKEALRRNLLDDLWRTKSATSPRALAALVQSEPVLEAIRRELRQTSGHRLEAKELGRLLAATVLRPEL